MRIDQPALRYAVELSQEEVWALRLALKRLVEDAQPATALPIPRDLMSAASAMLQQFRNAMEVPTKP